MSGEGVFKDGGIVVDMTKNMPIEVALNSVKKGAKIARAGWADRGMYVVAQKGYPNGIPINANTSAAIGQPEGTVVCFAPYMMMRAADGSFAPWTPCQGDLFARDWVILP